jgi:hypothetical protein
MVFAAPRSALQNAGPFFLPGDAARRNGLPTKVLDGTPGLGIYVLLRLTAALRRRLAAPAGVLPLIRDRECRKPFRLLLPAVPLLADVVEHRL